jgi:hypothetical protein
MAGTSCSTLTRKTAFHIVSFKKTARSQHSLVNRTPRKGKGGEGNEARQDSASEEREVGDAEQKSEGAHGSS